MMTARVLPALTLMAATGVLAACGGGAGKPPPGSSDKPAVATTTTEGVGEGRSNESGSEASATGGRPGYRKLLERQTSRPRTRFTPCNLVTRSQAQAIVGAPMREPFEAPQGPTCIYRTKRGDSLVTLAVQPLSLSGLKRSIRNRERVAVSGQVGYCGAYGQPVLYVELSGHRVLSVAARCSVAKRFAMEAIGQLDG